MKSAFLWGILGFLVGLAIGYIGFSSSREELPLPVLRPGHQVIGFLPYWLADKASGDYSGFITDLDYFALTIDSNGHILKLSNPQEEEPGYLALSSGKMNPFLNQAKKQKLKLSLTVFNSNQDSIPILMENPEQSAQNLAGDVIPLMKKYSFSDLNLDIEYTKQASAEAQLSFTAFTKELKNRLKSADAGTLTIDISPTDLIKSDLIDPQLIAPYADRIVLMAYDYHYSGSSVTGPVAPLFGGGTVSEFDIETAVEKALAIMPSSKLILGTPLYGYEWETLTDFPRSAVIPGTGLVASNSRVEDFLSSCASCSALLDNAAREKYLIYKDQLTGTFHQIFYPEAGATSAKIDYAKSKKLGGLALWALGYEGPGILDPLRNYK